MRNSIALVLSLLLAACGGGSGAGGSACDTCSTGSSIPVGTVSGASFDGLIINGTVRVYDFTTGAKGALLGSAQTDGNGLYSLSLQVETRPVLIEVTGGYYVEEAGTIPANISLSSNHKLTAVANYTTGATLAVAVTTYSHLAAGLAAYQIKNGAAVTTAINTANTRVSSLVGVDILTTTPKEITDSGNASASLTPPLRYGFLAGAISDWTYSHAPAAAVPHQPPYTSIDFAQLLYQDIAADGLLDGVGTGGASLSFGTTPLGVDVYRLGIGTGIVRIAASGNNKTGLDGAKVLSFAQNYIANTDAFFNGVPVVAFAAPVVSIVTPATNTWARSTINVSASASSPFGLRSAELLVDGVSVATSANLASPSFTLDTTPLSETPHALTVSSTDFGGFVTTNTIQVKVDNTPPTTTSLALVGTTCAPCVDYSTATDNLSGVASVKQFVFAYGVPAAPVANSLWAWPTGSVPTSLAVNAAGYWTTSAMQPFWFLGSFPTYQVQDKAGNCSMYGYLYVNQVFTWSLLGTNYGCY
jgi:hypothetical protein